jgi:hypothetical protein
MDILRVLLVLGILLFPSAGQPKSSLKGEVKDTEGAAIAGARIVVHWDPAGSRVGLTSNIGIEKDLQLIADQSGNFDADLPPGFYDLFISASAFSPSCMKIRVKASTTVTYTTKLKLSGLVAKELD